MVMVVAVKRVTRDDPVVRHSPCSRGRFAVTSVTAAVLAVTGHAVGSGALPTSCAPLITALALAMAATWAAAWAARRTRGPSAALVALAAGQLAIEALLSAPADGLPGAPPGALVVHASATLALGVLLLGVDRTVDDLSRALDRVLPRWWRVPVLPAISRRPPRNPAARIDVAGAVLSHSPRSPRGPPALA